MVQRMILNETAYFGKGAITEIVNEVQKRQFTKALIVTDKGLMQNGVAKKVIDFVPTPKS